MTASERFGFQSVADYLQKTLLEGGGPRYDRRAVHRVGQILMLQYLLESERIQHTRSQLRTIERERLRNQTLRRLSGMLDPLRKTCDHCQLVIYDYSWRYGWKSMDGNGTILCENCYKKFTDGKLQEQ